MRWSGCLALFSIFLFTATVSAQQAGSIRGVVFDKDFDVPLAAAQVVITETGEKVTASDEGNFVFVQVPPGKYTLVFSKPGYSRKVETNVVVSTGQMTEVDVSLSGEFTEMEEFVVQDLQIGGTEAGLLMLRVESPALLDSISSELLSQAGAGDAASALKLVAGATVQDGKYAVIRGLPDRYVNSQMNAVRLPTADTDKRAVQLDQFPSEMIASVQVSKTFTPDQQGDASGGAVNVVLKGIPEEPVFKVKAKTGRNSQVPGKGEFLTYKDGGVNFQAKDDGGRGLPTDFSDVNPSVTGVSRGDAPMDYDFAVTAGGKKEFDYDIKVGGFASAYYKRYSSYYDNGIDDSYWVDVPGDPMIPQTAQIIESQDTRLFDVTKGTQEASNGVLLSLGAEAADQAVTVLYMHTQSAEDEAILSEDTRGKEYYFPGYDRTDPDDPGNQNVDYSPYLRFETLKYTERSTNTLQVNGQHPLNVPEWGVDDFFSILPPEIDWTLAWSKADLDEPDRRQFGSYWQPIFSGPSAPGQHQSYKPAANFFLGNFQETWQSVSEDSSQYFVNNKMPFEQWDGEKGYVKVGLFHDRVKRTFDQESFSNFQQYGSYIGEWDDFWSAVFPDQDPRVFDGGLTNALDVDYKGDQEISANYYMVDLPFAPWMKLTGGARYETTKLSIINDPEPNARWVPLDSQNLLPLAGTPGAADVSFKQKDVLPAVGLTFNPVKNVTLRTSYAETVARQTFKELSPIMQQEYLGGPVFIGNQELQMSYVKNYDVRLDFNPYDGGLVSFSHFFKYIDDPIEYVQQTTTSFGFTRPVNYPKGRLAGYEMEARQQLGRFWEPLQGLSVGANATFIKSEVTLPDDEAELFNDVNIQAPMAKRDMLNAPDRLYNIFMTYNFERSGTDIGLFYTVKGDTLVEGAGQVKGNYVPNVYAKEYGTLNLSLSQKLGKNFKLTFQAKNLTNPRIMEVYRSEYIEEDQLKTSYTKGIDYSLSLTGEW